MALSEKATIFLVGFMGAGKSTVAKVLAKQLSMPYIDLDSAIESSAGKTVSVIFAEEGEKGFRQREERILEQICDGRRAVVATGGGTPCVGDNLEKMKTWGTVIHLSTPLATALARARSGGRRPLLSQTDQEIEELHTRRVSVYRKADVSINTNTMSISAVAGNIEKALLASSTLPNRLAARSATVALQERSYSVVVEPGCLDALGETLSSVLPGVKTVCLISDENVFPLYGRKITTILDAAGIQAVPCQIAAGETSKNLTTVETVCDAMISGGLDRGAAVVALGGGVVGDIAGFAAASVFRGIPVVHIPTTLLAMTDSAIGGKTGVNSRFGKNLIGAFWQPALVLADPDTLTTLPIREYRAAFGELLKYGLLDAAMWPVVETLASRVDADCVRGSVVVDESLCDFVRDCAAFKATVVSTDEREEGLRAILNLGHTVGHAIEAAAGYGRLLHGEAVALGLLAACRLSHRLGFCTADLESRVCALVKSAGLDANVDRWITMDVLKGIGVDKKRSGSLVRFVAIAKPGDIRLHDIELSELIGLLLAD